MEARAARDLWRDVAPLAGSPAPPSGGLGIGWPAPTAAPAPAVAPQRPPLWWIGDRLASSRARRPAPQLRPAPRASPPGGSGIGCPSSRACRPAPWAIYGLRNGENYKSKDHFKNFSPLRGNCPRFKKIAKKGLTGGQTPCYSAAIRRGSDPKKSRRTRK